MDKDTLVLALLIALFILNLAPRRYVRKVRGYPGRFIFWQWKKLSHVSAFVYAWLVDHMNGNNE